MSMRSSNVGYQLGSLLLGLVAVSTLYGITVVQSHRYFKKCKSDPLRLKLYVFALWILDTVHLGFEIWGNYYYLITHFGNEDTYRIEPSLGHMLGNQVAVITILLCQLLLVQRVWNYACARNVHRSLYLMLSIMMLGLSLFSAGAIFYLGLNNITDRTMSNGYTTIIRDLLYAGLSTGMAADVLIAVVLCFQLKDSRVGFKRTNNVVDRLILYAVNTCVLTTLVQCFGLVAYIVWPETNILMAVLSTLSKFYLNSILAVLNGRPKLREKLMYGSGHDVTWEVGHIPTASGGTLSTTSGQFCSSGTISVHVNGSAQSDDMDKAKESACQV